MSSSSASADVIDGYLVLSFPNSLDPIVWRMSLDKIGTASFEVKQTKNSEETKLILKPQKGTAEIIAPFANKQEAVDALMLASKALQESPTTIQKKQKVTVQSADQENQSHETVIVRSKSSGNEKQKWLIAILGAFIVIGLYLYLISLIPGETQSFNNTASVNTSVQNPSEATGVPVSADDFLNGL